jgi:predicted site-specific integrase-resolvase
MSSLNYPSLLTPGQAAEFLCVSPHTLAVWRSTGRYDLPYIKTGRLVRYKHTDLISFIENRTRNDYSQSEAN